MLAMVLLPIRIKPLKMSSKHLLLTRIAMDPSTTITIILYLLRVTLAKSILLQIMRLIITPKTAVLLHNRIRAIL